MGKSRADIQREYRRRKKEKEGEAYFQKERSRVKSYYVPVSERSAKDANKRREKVKEWVTLHRKRQKEAKLIADDEAPETEDSSSQDEVQHLNSFEQHNQTTDKNVVSSSTDPPRRLIVKIPFTDAKTRSRKRISRATAKARRVMNSLKTQNETLLRGYKRVCRRYERLTKKVNQNITCNPVRNEKSSTMDQSESDACTPRKRTAGELRSVGLSPRKIPRKIRTKLLLANVLTDEIKLARQANGLKGNQVVRRVVSGNILRKYRMNRSLGKLTGISRKGLKSNMKQCSSIPRMMKLQKQRQELQNDITSFLERDDNSRVMPGKNETKTEKKEKRQKRVLNDNLSYLHLKFISENTTVKLSLATFCRMRPKHISLTKYISRNQCLCQKHQNMALLLKGIKASGCEVPINPDAYARKLGDVTPTEFLKELKGESVTYEKWKKVDMPDGKKRTKIVEQKVSRHEFCEIVAEQSCEFLGHVNRVKDQYKAITDLKDKLPTGHVAVQMDFAENYNCCSADEVQSAYWNASAVTLHPVVVYYRTEGEESLKHKSFVYVSDCLGHNIGTVFAFLKKLVPELQQQFDHLEWVHYWTDSPSSQYRNKTAFYIISDHKQLLNVQASWNYFETGHGKGPCDGVGGTAKRMADQTVKQGKMCIQDAHDFYQWGKKFHTSANYVFVSADECDDARSELAEFNKHIIPVKGTMKIHAVVPVRPGVVRTRITSCYCEQCIAGNYHNDWSLSSILKQEPPKNLTEVSVPDDSVPDPDPETEVNEGLELTGPELRQGAHNINGNPGETERLHISPNDWIAVMYQREWHIGQVKDVDDEDGDCLVTFLQLCSRKHTASHAFKWPNPADEIWVNFSSVLCKIQSPEPIGRSGRTFRIHAEDVLCIRETFQKRTT